MAMSETTVGPACAPQADEETMAPSVESEADTRRIGFWHSVWAALLNPALLCLFLPIIEGKPAVVFGGPKGFWAQLGLAVAIALILSFLPPFGKAVDAFVRCFRFSKEGPGATIAGTICGATLLFCVIGLAEVILTTGVGTVGETTLLSRWQSLIIKGWAFVVIGGLLIELVCMGLAWGMAHGSRWHQ